MHTCGRHGELLIELNDGDRVCPRCEADAVYARLSGGLEATQDEADWVVPLGAEHPPGNLKVVTMRLENRDLERAKLLAKERGVPYQRYLRALVTRALDQEERQLFGQRVSDASPHAADDERERVGRRA